MRATDFIRALLDLLDNIPDEESIVPTDTGAEYENTPDELYASVDQITVDAGGGVNGPKHPSDIRSDAVSMYPNTQYNPRR